MILAYNLSLFAFLVTVLGLGTSLHAEDGDDTLRYYRSRSRLVVSGEIGGLHGGVMQGSLAHYGCTLKVTRVLRGSVGEKEIRFGFQRFVHPLKQSMDEYPEHLKDGGRVIVFLRRAVEAHGEGHGWMGVDPWFAVQPASEAMEKALSRLMADPEPEPKVLDVGESAERTLRYYKSRASLVVSGEVKETSLPEYGDKSTSTRTMRIKVGRIMRGSLQGDEIRASVVRFEDKSSAPAFLKSGKQVILFLHERAGQPRYETVDPWFGLQQFNSVMEIAIDKVHDD